MSDWYWLVDGKIVPAPPGQYMQPDDQRRIGLYEFGKDSSVSTVFLSLDHSFRSSVPVLFETMVFWHGNPLDQECERYETLEQAKAGHERWVKQVEFIRSANFVGAEVQ